MRSPLTITVEARTGRGPPLFGTLSFNKRNASSIGGRVEFSFTCFLTQMNAFPEVRKSPLFWR